MSETLGLGDIEGDFKCCSNAWPYPFKCSRCGHVMAFCVETDDLFPNLHDLGEIAEGVNAHDPGRPIFECPRCGHSFEYYFMENEAYRVTRQEMIDRGFGHLLVERLP